MGLFQVTLLQTPLLGKVVNPMNLTYQGVGGITIFINNIVKLTTTIAGLLLFINLITAGLKYITSGSDPKALQEAQNSILMSIIGLAIIVFAFIIIAVLSLVFFGNPTAILNPVIYGPGNNPSLPAVCTTTPVANLSPSDCVLCGHIYSSGGLGTCR